MMRKLNKIVLMNTEFENSTHEIIDSALAITASAIAPTVELAFIKQQNACIRKHVEKHCMGARIITSDEFRVPFFHKLRYGYQKIALGLQDVYVFLKKGGRNNVVFLTYACSFDMLFLNFISKITGWPLIICVHSDAEHHSTPINEHDGLRSRIAKRFFTKTKLGKHVRMMVLSDDILSTLLKRIPESEHYKFLAWDHPYFETKKRQSKRLDKEIKVGVIGYVTKDPERGLDNILEFAKQVGSHPDITFSLLGSIQEDGVLERMPSTMNIKNPTGTLVERSVYDNWVEELDYIYCPYPDNAFQLTASGAILDVIMSKRPIISHANAYFLSLRKKYGKFGLMIENGNWQEVINKLKDPAEYDRLVAEQNKLISMLTPENHIDKLRKVIETVV